MEKLHLSVMTFYLSLNWVIISLSILFQVMEAEERNGSDGDDGGRKRLRRNWV